MDTEDRRNLEHRQDHGHWGEQEESVSTAGTWTLEDIRNLQFGQGHNGKEHGQDKVEKDRREQEGKVNEDKRTEMEKVKINWSRANNMVEGWQEQWQEGKDWDTVDKERIKCATIRGRLGYDKEQAKIRG